MNTIIYPFALMFALTLITFSKPMNGQNLIEGHHDYLQISSENPVERYFFPDQKSGCFEMEICGLEVDKEYSFTMGYSWSADIVNLLLLEGGRTINSKKGQLELLVQSDCILVEICLERDKNASIPFLSYSIVGDAKDNNSFSRNNFERSSSSIGWRNSIDTDQLARNFLMDTNFFHVENIKSIGPEPGRGIFYNGGNSIGIEQGVVLSTGHLRNIEGPNVSSARGNNLSGTGDVDLMQLSSQQPVFDAVGVEFDFIPSTRSFKIRYVFASEEYCEFVGMGFNDVMGIFLSGPGISGDFSNGAINLATISGTGQNVSVDNLNHQINPELFIDNTPAGQIQAGGGGEVCGSLLDQDGIAVDFIEFDGFSQVMEAVVTLIPNETYHLKIIVGDVLDASYDSAIFLEMVEALDYGTEVSEVLNPVTGRVWMDRNLGADRTAYISRDARSYGDLYQWGRNTDGHQLRNSDTNENLSNGDLPGHGDFIVAPAPHRDWRSTPNNELWQGESGVNNPCPEGFRLPTIAEWEEEIQTWSSNDLQGAFNSTLKLPATGMRNSGGDIFGDGTTGFYWSSTVGQDQARAIAIYKNFAFARNSSKASGVAVRCIKMEDDEMFRVEESELDKPTLGTEDLIPGKTKSAVDLIPDIHSKSEIKEQYASGLSIYPNPGDGHFTIELKTAAEANPAELVVTNSMGSTIHRQKIGALPIQIDLSSEISGLYMIHILDAAGRILDSGRLVKY